MQGGYRGAFRLQRPGELLSCDLAGQTQQNQLILLVDLPRTRGLHDNDVSLRTGDPDWNRQLAASVARSEGQFLGCPPGDVADQHCLPGDGCLSRGALAESYPRGLSQL
jgi:hypothetical protein